MMNAKKTILFTTLLLISFLPLVYAQNVRSTQFTVFIGSGGSLGLQPIENKTIILTVLSGNLSSSTCSVYILSRESGYFNFVAENDTTIQIDFTNLENQISVKGDSGHDSRYIANGATFVIVKGNGVSVRWFYGISDWFSWMIMPLMGIGGFVLCGIGVFYVGQKIRERDTFGTIKATLYAMLIVLIGAGLIIGWLW